MKVPLQVFILLSVFEVSESFPVNPQDGSSMKNTIRYHGESQTADNRMLRRLTGNGELWCETSDLEEELEDAMGYDPTYALYWGNLPGVGREEAPNAVECSPSSEYGSCPALVYSGIEDELHDHESIVAPHYTPNTHHEPCTQCDFRYYRDSFTYVAPCGGFECLPRDNNGTTPENVTVQYKVKRSDFFRTVQYTSPYSSSLRGHSYTCTWHADKKSYQIDFWMGVTNARTTTFVLSNSFLDGNIDPTPGVVDSCSYSVDDIACSSCRICDDSDLGLYELDCSNIRSGATASCDEYTVNPFNGYFPKLFTLQEGFEFPPTDPPTPQPSTDPTESSIDPPTELTDSTEPTLPKYAIYIVAGFSLLGLAVVVFFIREYCKNNNKNGREKKKVLPSYSKPSTTKQPSKQVESTIASVPPVGERVLHFPIDKMTEKPMLHNKAEDETVDKQEERDDGKHSSRNKTTTDGHDSCRHSHRQHHSHHRHPSESHDSSADGKHHHHHHHRRSHRHNDDH